MGHVYVRAFNLVIQIWMMRFDCIIEFEIIRWIWKLNLREATEINRSIMVVHFLHRLNNYAHILMCGEQNYVNITSFALTATMSSQIVCFNNVLYGFA